MQCNYIGRMDSKMELFADNNNGFGDAGKIKVRIEGGGGGVLRFVGFGKGVRNRDYIKSGSCFLFRATAGHLCFFFFKLGKQEKFLQIRNRSLIIKGRIFQLLPHYRAVNVLLVRVHPPINTLFADAILLLQNNKYHIICNDAQIFTHYVMQKEMNRYSTY